MAKKIWLSAILLVTGLAGAYWYFVQPHPHYHTVTVIKLKRGLSSPFENTRIAAARKLTYQNCSLEVAEDDLREALTDRSPEVRMLCASSLLQIAENDPAALDTLLECLKLDDKRLVQKTINEIGTGGRGSIRLDQHPITHLIFDMFESDDPELYENAKWYLSNCGDRGAVVERTMRLLGDEKAKDYNLGELIQASRDIEMGYLTFDQAIRLLEEGNPETQAEVIRGLGSFREGIPLEMIPAVLTMVENADSKTALTAATHLGRTKELPDCAIDTVNRLIRSPDEKRRGLALRIISWGDGGLHGRAPSVAPELFDWLKSDPASDGYGREYRGDIMMSLLHFGPEVTDQLNQFVLEEIAKDPEKLDESAMVVLRKMGSKAEPAIPQLLVLMRHYSDYKADNAAKTLTAIKPGLPEVISYAKGLTRHKFDFRRSKGRDLLEANGYEDEK